MVVIALIVSLGTQFGAVSAQAATFTPTITSDLADYNPGQTVKLTGTQWDPAGSQVHVVVNDDSGQTWQHVVDVAPASDGTIVDTFSLPNYFVAQYGVTATQTAADGSALQATTSFTDANPSANLDQCANDPLPSPSTDGCDTSATQWVNGNLGSSKSVYFEGDSIPYRLTFGSLSTSGTHTVTIEWDTTKSGTHALDYLTTFNQSVADADPCLGVSGCTGPPSVKPIPADGQVIGAGVTPIPGNFSLYGGTINSVGSYSYPSGTGFAGDKSARISITFTASVANPVLAWGGHISTRKDWGANNSAVAISGSPYHTSLVDLDGSGGNQDRSLSADAVIFPGSITIVKDATPNGSQAFSFTGSPTPLTNFSLVDDGTSANTKVFSNIINFQTYTVAEGAQTSPWIFDSASCSVTTPNGGSQTVSGSTATIKLAEGENVTCTYLNHRLANPHLKLVKTVTNDNGGSASATDFTLTATGPQTISGAGGTESDVAPGTYTLSETNLPGYTAGSWSCTGGTFTAPNKIALDFTQSATCTINNNDQTAHLKLVKTVTNDNGGTAVATDFTLSAAGPTPISGAGGAESDVNAGSYTLSETNLPGYTAGSWSCVGGSLSGSKVTLALGESATCTINNNDNSAHLKIVKTVTNDNGGTAKATDFTLSAAGPTPISGAGGADSDVNAGSYTLSETNLPGYTAGSWSCSGGTFTAPNTVALDLGQSATCTINNNDQTAHLKLVKTVTNDNGGTAVATDFTLSAAGPTPISGAGGADSDVNAGSYSLSETNLPGYTAGTWSCTGGTFTAPDQIAVALGQSATCTINNNDQTAHLKLVKTVTNDNGGTATPGDFTLYGDGPTPLSGKGIAESDVNAGAYLLSEAGPAGYTGGAWSCTGGTQNGSSITLAVGESAVCTIDNNDKTAHLTLVKEVVNDNGGTALPGDFNLSATGPTSISGAGGVSKDVNAGSYNLTELGPAGYSAGAWSCNGGTQNGSNITLALGESAICTIVNNDIAPKLHLRKIVVNDNGGTATVANFTLTANGTGSNDLSGTSPVDSDPGLQADSWALSESGPTGYSSSGWVCVGGQQSGNSITLGIAEEATCTITNDDQAAHLKIVKTVTNDNGGTAKATDFTLSAAGPTPISGAGGAESDVNAGSYTLSETNLPGYTAGSWSCTGGTFTGPDKIALALGESATCTINNNDQTAHLKIVKTVTNDNGGTAKATDFTLSAAGPTPISGAGGAESDVNAGSYTLSETNLPGYTAGAWSCVGGSQSGSSISLALGESATCAINNNDQTAHLTLVKTVTNDNGGTAKTTDFTLSAAGPTPISGAGGAESDVNAGSYSLSETNLPGYTAGSWSCTGGTFTAPGQIALALGQSATCTINNNDNAPALHLRKVVVNDNGGTATVANFTLSADGTGSNDLSGTSPVDSGAGLKADTFALSETGVAGYAASGWTCVGGTQNGSNITLALGESATCTITNNDIAPKLHLRKIVVNDNGGTKTVADFTLSAIGTGGNNLSGTSPVDSGTGLKADTWALSETSVYGYTASAWSCVGGTQSGSNITVGIGGEATCTITNNDQPGTIIIKKVTKPLNTGSFAFTTTGTGYTGFTLPGGGQNSQTLNAGSYTVKESTQLGWILTGIGGSTDPTTPYNCVVTGSGGSTGVGDLTTQTASISLKNGDTVTCTFENTGQGVTRTQGFWATHPQLAQIAWFGGTAFGHTFPGVAATAGIGDATLCGRPIDTLGKLMGGFWSGVSTTSTGAKRSSLDQARMQLLQQLLAAELNASAFGSVPSGGSGMFAQWEAAYCGTNTNAIKNAQQQAASFNTAGDSSTFTPGTSADSKNARAIANYTWWDNLP
ncbi:hypothetical protein N865_08770 [Intrasporangium oryzae NRRL B-24470]|uniref:Uncharacterized protein n=1 Tax=Intrasporangium oryzae NRRL B-24470 TaxID=1386089 RepID=W9GC91_9MICO|nr:hypothetical protein [Intrasporangium oryzae]EWT03680.1 hypothetical protein N865_08770 [Intrasporangium oryzae NRRL B-24470]